MIEVAIAGGQAPWTPRRRRRHGRAVELRTRPHGSRWTGSTAVQYRSATGIANPSGVVPLTGSIPAHGHFLLAWPGGSNGSALPVAVDQDNTTVNLSGTTGTVFLALYYRSTAPPTGSVTGNSQIADLVGFGTSNTFETAVAPSPGTATTIGRPAAGTDTDSNATDFAAGAPTP